MRKSALVALMTVAMSAPAALGRPCAGDCNEDGTVTIAEIVRAVVRMVATTDAAPPCPALDPDGDGVIWINDVIAGIDSALHGCRTDSNHRSSRTVH